MNKNQCDRFLRWVYNEINKGKIQIRFKKMGKLDGEFDYDGLVMYIDPRCDILKTLLHEFYHIRNPHTGEDIVEKKEKLIANFLSERQYRTLIKRLAKAL